MMDIDLTELELYRNPYATDLGRAIAMPASVPTITKEEITRAARAARERLGALYAEGEAAYHTSAAGRAFAASRAHGPYSLHTRKGDGSVDQVQRYTLRDAVQWLTLWTGCRDNRLWRCVVKLAAFTTSLDDICVPFGDIEDGRYLFVGESLAAIIARLRHLGGSGRDERWLEHAVADIHFAGRMQFFEKWATCPDAPARAPAALDPVRLYVTEGDMLRASALRYYSTMTIAGLCFISYYFGLGYGECDWALFNAACIGDTLGMDIGKDVAAIGVRCPTNFGDRLDHAADDNARRRRDILAVYLGLNRHFRDAVSVADLVYERFSRAALSFASKHDRYVERHQMARFPIDGALAALVDRVAAGD